MTSGRSRVKEIKVVKPTIVELQGDTSTPTPSYKLLLIFKSYAVTIPVQLEYDYIQFSSDYAATEFLLNLYQKGYKFFDSVKYRSFGNVDGYLDVAPHPIGTGKGKRKRKGRGSSGIGGKATSTTTTTTTG